jgi:hypothetical protein
MCFLLTATRQKNDREVVAHAIGARSLSIHHFLKVVFIFYAAHFSSPCEKNLC